MDGESAKENTRKKLPCEAKVSLNCCKEFSFVAQYFHLRIHNSMRSPRRISRRRSKSRGKQTRPPNVHEWSRRSVHNGVENKVKREMIHPRPSATIDLSRTGDVLRGGSEQAKDMYKKLHWEGNTSYKAAVNTKVFPLDILIVERVKPAESFFVNDPRYARVTSTYRLISSSCIVCDNTGSIICVFVTRKALPTLQHLSVQARIAQQNAVDNLVARHSFAVGGDYARDPEYRDKVQNMQVRMKGTIWNDGLQTYTSATPGWQGKYFTQYFRRRPESNIVPFALPYVGMYAAEKLVVPSIGEERLRLCTESKLPCALAGVGCDLMPATQVGISQDFSVRTHADSCVSGVTETIFWANKNLPNLRFAVTSVKIQFDIGKQECILFQKGNEMHGTVPGGSGSCGLVLISKRNTLYHFRKNDTFTNRTG